MIGPSQRMKRCSPPKRAMRSWPGLEEEVEGVAEHHVVAEAGHVAGLEALHDRLRGERDEGGRAHLAVRGAQDPGAARACEPGSRERMARRGGPRESRARSADCLPYGLGLGALDRLGLRRPRRR